MGVFDEVLVYVDEATEAPKISCVVQPTFIFDGKHRAIHEGINHIVKIASGDWICCFCDDDYFLYPAIENFVNKIKGGEYAEADVVHFKVMTDGGEWGATHDFSLEEIIDNNRIPFGSFFKKSAFESIGGFKIEPLNDWNFWIRMKRAGKRFMSFNECVYFFRVRGDSLTQRLDIKYGGMENISRMVRETL